MEDTSSSASTILDDLRPGSVILNLNGRPYRQSQDASWYIKDAVYKDYDLFVCYGGSALFSFSGTNHELCSGQALLCPPGVPINARKTSPGNFEAIAQHFDLHLAGSVDFLGLIEYRNKVQLSEWPALGADYHRYVDLQDRDKSAMIREGLFSVVLFSFLRDAYLSDRIPAYDRLRFVSDIAASLDRRYAYEDALEQAMANLPYSRDYAVRLFRQRFGMAPTEYLMRCRMNAARDFLLSGMAVKEAARKVGIQDELYFSRLFTRREGLSPLKFRQSHRQG
jgi:AraC-like DNA-binding protein